MLEKEATVTEKTNKVLYETKTRTKYTTQKSNVFMKKDIKREIISCDKPRSSSQISSQTSFSIQNVLPYIGVSDTGHAEDRFPTRHLSTPNRHAGVTSKD